MTIPPEAQSNSRGTPSPYLVIRLNVSHQDGQVLNAKVHVIVDVLVDALICWPGVSGEGRERRKLLIPAFATHPISSREPAPGPPSLTNYAVMTTWLKSNPYSVTAKPWTLRGRRPITTLITQPITGPESTLFPLLLLAAPINHHQRSMQTPKVILSENQ